MSFPFHQIEADLIGGQLGGQINSIMNDLIDLTERQKEILQLINIDHKISRLKIATKLNINESAVQKHLKYLKDKGYIIRIDGSRGYWKINLKE